MSFLQDLSQRIAISPLSTFIESAAWMVPTVQTVHILSISVVAASALMLDLRLVGAFARDQPLVQVAHRFLPWIWFALLILAVSGSILIIGEPARSLPNPVFQAKLAMIAAAVMVTLTLQRPLKTDPQFWERSPQRVLAGRSLAVVSVVLWGCIICAGRWIAYTWEY